MRKPRARRSGFAYLLALSVVTMVALLALVLGRGIALHLRAENGAAARAQCEQAALGMIRAAVHDLETTRNAGQLPALTTVHPEGEQIGDCIVMLIGRDPNAAKVVFGPIAEAGKLDVNIASAEQLAALPGMTLPLAGAIADWRDADDEADKNGGAERNDYAGEPVPYAPRNAPLESLDELRLVRGMTDALYFGEDANQNGVLDPGEDTDGDGRLTPGLRDLLTLDAREPALAPDDSAKVDVRSAGRVRDLLVKLFGKGRGGELLASLKAPPFSNRLDFISASALTDEETGKIWPYLTGPEGRVGLLDAYASRAEVLTAVLGEDATPQTILSARPAAAPATPHWLARALDRNRIGSLTSGSYQFTLDALAVRTDGAGFARLQAVVDVSGKTARVSVIRPAETQGWPLPWITLAQLRQRPSGSDPLQLLSNPSR